MKPRIALPVLAALALVVSPTLADKPYWFGKPDYHPGEQQGYFLWKDENGWHLRWLTKNRKHQFSGTITCDGAFKNVDARSKDDKKDVIERGEGRNTIVFDTTVAGGRDGVDFGLSANTSKVTFDLKMDGQRVEPKRVRIGRNKRFPDAVPFTLER